MTNHIKLLSLILVVSGFLSGADHPPIQINLYPWNVSLSTYHTEGKYSSSGDYISNAFYFSMDKRNKDRFTVSIEDITISDGLYQYKQTNLFGRDNFYINSGLSIGGILGRFNAESSVILDTTESVSYPGSGTLHRVVRSEPSGWVTGFQIMGDLPWFGYSVSYLNSKYVDVFDYVDQYEYNSYPDTTLSYSFYEQENFDQFNLLLSKRWGEHIFRMGMIQHQFPHDTYFSTSINWDWTVTESITTSVYYSKGEGRYTVDPSLLLLDNNPDILTDVLNLRTAWRMTTHWTLTGIVSNHRYDSNQTSELYYVNYWAIGLQLRF